MRGISSCGNTPLHGPLKKGLISHFPLPACKGHKRAIFYKLSFLFFPVTKNILGPKRPIFSNFGFLSVMKNNTVVLKRAISCSVFLLDHTAFSYRLPWLSVTTLLAIYLHNPTDSSLYIRVFQPPRWRYNVPKCQYLPTRLHSITIQKTKI
jgi:hypothetical protein